MVSIVPIVRALRRSALSIAAALAVIPAAPAAAAPSWPGPSLGAPHTAGYSVTDVDAAKVELAKASGIQFGRTTTSRTTVVVADVGVRKVTLKVTRSVRGGPFVELVQATPPVGPWATSAEQASFFLSYRVESVWAAGTPLAIAGMTIVAFSGSDFVIWRSPEGVLIRLIDADLVPATGSVNQPEAPHDFGQPVALAFTPCDAPQLKTLFTEALGVTWRPHAEFPLPYEFRDGSSGVINGEVDATLTGPPFLTVETPSHVPYVCTPTATPVHPIFLSEDVPGYVAQALGAGMDWTARVPGLTSHHRGASGVFLEIADAALLGEL